MAEQQQQHTDYYITYEYKQIQDEVVKMNEKMDKILTLLEKKKPRKNILSEVNSKMDNLLDQVVNNNKKRKLDINDDDDNDNNYI